MGRRIGRGDSNSLAGGLIGLVVFLLMGGMFLKDFIGYSGELKDFNRIQTSDCRVGDYVEGNVNLVLGYYCEEESKRNGLTTATYRYYLIPFGDNQDKLIGIKVSESQFAQFDKLCEDTYKSFDGTVQQVNPIGKFQGKIKKCDGQELGYLKEWLDEAWEGEDYSQSYVPYYIECGSASINLCMVIMMGTIGFIIVLFVIVVQIKAKKQQQIRNSVTTSSDRNIRVNRGEVLYSADELNSSEEVKKTNTLSNSMLFEEE